MDDPSTITAYLAVHDARAAIEWYRDAFGATISDDPIVMADGRIGHAELEVFGTIVFLSDEHPEIGVVAPDARGNDVTLHVAVESADEVAARAGEHGATVVRECSDTPNGRIGVLRDPFGHRWMFNSPAGARSAT